MPITDWERDKVLTVCKKLMDGEPLSRQDMERYIWFLDNCPPQLEMLDQSTAAGLQIKFRSTLAARYLPQQIQNQMQGQK